MGEDARCFDVEDPDGMEDYMLDRLREAYANAGASLTGSTFSNNFP